MTWEPLFTEENQKEVIFNRIKVIAEEIQDIEQESLLTGKAGIAVFYFYLYRLTNKEEYGVKAGSLIQECIDAISNKRMAPNFGKGFIGIAWSLLHLSKNGFIDINLNVAFEDLDNYVFSTSKLNIEKNNFDSWYGGIGGGLYFLERLPHSFAANALKQLIDQLYINAEKNGNEIKWNNVFISTQPEVEEQKEYNLGLSHGIPSIISFLSLAYYNNISKEKCLKLLRGSINWLLKQRLISKTTLSLFPTVTLNNLESESSRLAWCYGDLGVAIAIWNAGCFTNNECWKNEAIKILIHSSKRRNWLENQVFDACLCHGSIGIAHIFNRFFQHTGIEEFKEAAIYWTCLGFEKKFDGGLAGFKFYVGDGNKYENNSGLLEGVAGVGLALVSVISNIKPKWDRIFFLS